MTLCVGNEFSIYHLGDSGNFKRIVHTFTMILKLSKQYLCLSCIFFAWFKNQCNIAKVGYAFSNGALKLSGVSIGKYCICKDHRSIKLVSCSSEMMISDVSYITKR